MKKYPFLIEPPKFILVNKISKREIECTEFAVRQLQVEIAKGNINCKLWHVIDVAYGVKGTFRIDGIIREDLPSMSLSVKQCIELIQSRRELLNSLPPHNKPAH